MVSCLFVRRRILVSTLLSSFSCLTLTSSHSLVLVTILIKHHATYSMLVSILTPRLGFTTIKFLVLVLVPPADQII